MAATDKARITVTRDLGGRDSMTTVRSRVIPRTFRLEVARDDGTPDLRLGFQVRDGVPQCRSAELRSTDEGREVLASDLRGVRLEDLLEVALVQVGLVFETSGEGDTLLTTMEPIGTVDEARQTLAEMRGVRREARRKVSDEFLREVAEVYRANVSDKPTTAVARWSGKKHRTAGLYVKQAREKGYLGPAVVGKAGEEQS
jgi:hypothetical protein